MRRKIEENVLEERVGGGECHHHWLIESAKGPISRGVCKLCGARREFLNSLPQYVPDSVVKRHVQFNELPELDIESDREQRKS